MDWRMQRWEAPNRLVAEPLKWKAAVAAAVVVVVVAAAAGPVVAEDTAAAVER